MDKSPFCWIDMMTPNVATTKSFYQKLLDWKYTDEPIPMGTYTKISVKDGEVGGITELTGDMAKNVPPHVAAYVNVTDVNEAVKKAVGLGAKILMEPFDVMSYGRMATIQDPTGAALSFWQAKSHKGSTASPTTPGMYSWVELLTKDVKAATKFYSGMFGWSVETPSGPSPYIHFKSGGVDFGGMMEIRPEMGPMPSAWSVYFTVKSVDDAIKTATANGGRVCVPKTEISRGAFAALLDPLGVYFGIYHEK